MAIQITFNVADFQANIDQAAEQLLDRMARGVGRGAERVANAAKQNLAGDARDRGGLLSGSINVAMTRAGQTVTAEVGVGSGGDEVANFGVYVHEGTGIHSRTGMGRKDVPWPYPKKEGGWGLTSGLQPNPYLENAYLSEQNNVMRDVADAVGGG